MTRAHIAGAALLAVVTVGAATTAAPQTARVSVAPDSKLWIEGTSNLHGWSCTATAFQAQIDLDSAAVTALTSAVPNAVKRVEVKVPVKSLKCGHGGMDDNLYKALKADASSEISYILATFEAVPGDVKDSFTLHTIGTLTIAGTENKIRMDVSAARMPDGTIKATGVVPIKMSDYGIQPPTAIFGRLKTGDEVKVNFALTVASKAIAAVVANRP